MKLKYIIWIIVVCVALGVIFYPMVSGNESIHHKTVLEEIKLPVLTTTKNSSIITSSSVLDQPKEQARGSN